MPFITSRASSRFWDSTFLPVAVRRFVVAHHDGSRRAYLLPERALPIRLESDGVYR